MDCLSQGATIFRALFGGNVLFMGGVVWSQWSQWVKASKGFTVAVLLQVESTTRDVLSYWDPEGEKQFAEMKLKPTDLQMCLVGIVRDKAYAKDMNFCLDTYGPSF